MNSSKIQLPDFVISDLYKNQLVVIEEAFIDTKLPNKAEPTPPSKPEFLGNNQKNICILVKDTQAVYLNDHSLQFLSTILTACKLNLGDVAIVNFSRTPLLYPSLKEWLSPKYILVFDIGATTLQLPFELPTYQVQSYDKCSFLFAPALDQMTADTREAKIEKSKLWLSLKTMFNIA